MGGGMAPGQTQLVLSAMTPAERLRRPLLVQCWADEADTVAPLTDRLGGGLIITARDGDRRDLYRTARHLREVRGYRRPLLLDAARYADRRAGPASFSPEWLARQRELGVPVLTDSGYVARHDDEGLARILSRCAQLGDAIALLPLHPSWLVLPADRQALLTRIRAFGVPVAILLEHVADPFGVPGGVEGLLELLSCEVPVLLVRSDASALGALACGAVAAAVGTNAALRHLHPQRSSQNSVPSMFVRSCLSYKRLDMIAEAKRRTPASGLWWCDCPVCAGSELDWVLGRPFRDWAELAYRHSLHVLFDLRDYLIGPDPCLDRLSWRALCAAAAFQRQEAGWGRSSMLERWQRALPEQPAQSR